MSELSLIFQDLGKVFFTEVSGVQVGSLSGTSKEQKRMAHIPMKTWENLD